MTEATEDFWEKESEKMWELLGELQNKVEKFKESVDLEMELGEECNTLNGFFTSKMYPESSSLEEKEQAESKAKALEYDPKKGKVKKQARKIL